MLFVFIVCSIRQDTIIVWYIYLKVVF